MQKIKQLSTCLVQVFDFDDTTDFTLLAPSQNASVALTELLLTEGCEMLSAADYSRVRPGRLSVPGGSHLEIPEAAAAVSTASTLYSTLCICSMLTPPGPFCPRLLVFVQNGLHVPFFGVSTRYRALPSTHMWPH